jgi:hypothetical protein
MPHHVSDHVRFLPTRNKDGDPALGQVSKPLRGVGLIPQAVHYQNHQWDQIINSANQQSYCECAEGGDPECMHVSIDKVSAFRDLSQNFED